MNSKLERTLNWEYVTLDEVVDRGSSNISLNKIKEDEGDYPIYSAKGFYKNISFYHQEKEYIAIIKDGAGIGRLSVHPPKSSIVGTMQYLIPKDGFDLMFVKYFLTGINFNSYKQGATIPHIYFKDYKVELVPKLPIEEQKRIVAKIDALFAKIDKAIALTEESLKQVKNLLPSLLKEVFEKGKADGWEEKKLEEVCDVIGGGTPKTKISEYWDGEIVWLSPIDLPPIGEISIVSDSRKKITDIGLKKSSAKLLPKGSVVYSTRASIGKIAIAEIPLSTNQGFTNFICGDGINNRYLCFCLKHFNKTIENLSNSTTFKEVSKSAVKEFEIPVPSIDSQMKVVKIADDILLKSKQTQSKLEEQLAYLKQLKSSILSKAFKGEL